MLFSSPLLEVTPLHIGIGSLCVKVVGKREEMVKNKWLKCPVAISSINPDLSLKIQFSFSFSHVVNYEQVKFLVFNQRWFWWHSSDQTLLFSACVIWMSVSAHIWRKLRKERFASHVCKMWALRTPNYAGSNLALAVFYKLICCDQHLVCDCSVKIKIWKLLPPLPRALPDFSSCSIRLLRAVQIHKILYSSITNFINHYPQMVNYFKIHSTHAENESIRPHCLFINNSELNALGRKLNCNLILQHFVQLHYLNCVCALLATLLQMVQTFIINLI